MDKNQKTSSLKKRILSAVILAPLVLVALLANDWSFILVIVMAAAISFYEWYGLVNNDQHYIYKMGLGGLYMMICFSSYVFLRFGLEQGGWLALSVILCVWASDIGAYITGKIIGGAKLAPALSPKKTWAGLAGAMFFCGLTLVLLSSAAPYIASYTPTDIGLSSRHWGGIFLVGCLLGIIGQTGDLFISSFKRKAGTKDTGNLIPGHGGLLDRIDALLLVSPAFLMIVMLWLS